MDNEQVQSLIIDAKNGDNSAKAALIKSNSPLIKSVIRRFKNKGIEYDDLYQLGCIGFLKAIKNFLPEFGVKFSTYAVPMIAGEVKRFLRDDGYVKVSRATKSLSIKINRYIEEYKKNSNQSPRIEDIAKTFDIDVQEAVFAMDSGKMPISIYEKQDENSQSLFDKLSYSDEDKDINKIIIKDLINSLDSREKKIIMLRYYRDYTQSAVAKILGVSQVQVSRIEYRIIKKLRESLQ